ncbi:hypothetical protein [Maribacter sp. 2210JD10-5]|uniref:hypothetical protein n=1 Tax=Maribacter sp. 2210JD10-5 TaxID=3386272 RepID=UPI0039BD20CE
MKRVKELGFFKNIREVREFEFGVFYFFDDLVISEMNEGVIFSWKMAEKAMHAAHQINGNKAPVVYISNRINNYYIMPLDWIKFYRNRAKLNFYSVVGSTQGSMSSLILERFFFRKSIPKFTDLEEAITWSLEKLASQKE